MMIERAIAVQTRVYNALADALAPIEVSTSPSAAIRYVRVDTFSAVNDDEYKNGESSTHRFTVNAFDAPEGGTQSLAWVWATLNAADAALKSLRIEGVRVVAEDTQAWSEPATTEGVYDAHGFIRYRVQIGA